MNLAGSVQVNVTQDPSGPVTLTNDGTLNLEAGVQLQLYGPVYGQANFVQHSDGTLDVTPNSSVGGSSSDPIIYQPQCSGSGCQNQYINLAGTLKIAASGPRRSYLLWADNYGENPPNKPTTSGSFAHVDGGSASYAYSTNQNVGESVVINRL